MTSANWQAALATVGAFGAVGGFIDFYVGRDGQTRLKKFLENWWLTLSEVSWGNFGTEEALFALSIIDKFFGSKFFSLKRISSCFVIAAITVVIFFSLNFSFRFMGFREWVISTLQFISSMILFSAAVSINRAAIIAFIRLIKNNALINFFGFIVILFFSYLILTIFIAFYLTKSYFVYVFSQLYIFGGDTLIYDDVKTNLIQLYYHVSDQVYERYSANPEKLWGIYTEMFWKGPLSAVEVTLSVLPSLTRLLLAFIFTASYLIAPLKDPVLTLWSRIIDADKPVFALVFGGIAAFAKIIEGAIKIFL